VGRLTLRAVGTVGALGLTPRAVGLSLRAGHAPRVASHPATTLGWPCQLAVWSLVPAREDAQVCVDVAIIGADTHPQHS
jgi:hypothetical protein